MRPVPLEEASEPRNDDLAKGFLRLTCVVIVVDLIALIIGISFFLIAHGTMMGVIRLSSYWQPANAKLNKYLGSEVHPIALKGFQVFRFFVWWVVAAVFIVFGLWLLFIKGFCGQSILCR